MRVPAVAASVNLISNSTATLPAKVFARQPGAGKQVDGDHPAQGPVHREANPWTSAGELRRQLTADALKHDKGGLAVALRIDGRVVELIRIDPAAFTVEAHDVTSEPQYRVRFKNGGDRVYSHTDAIHILAPNGSPITLAREAIGLSIVLEAHAARLFGNGARPSGVLALKSNITPDGLAKAKAAWQAAHGGNNTGGVAVIPADAEWQSLVLTSVDAQFAEMRAFQIIEIARAFSVPVTMIGDLTRGTWSNSLEMRQQFLTFCLLPWLEIWQDAYSRVLLPDDQRKSHSVEFVTDDFTRADLAARAEAYSKFRASGILTSNEIRAMENRPPLPGGDSLDSPHVQSGKGATQ
jgi:HK97 family phage portal protein